MKRAASLIAAVLLTACNIRTKDPSGTLITTIPESEIGGPAIIQRIRDLVDDSLGGRIPGTPGGVKTAEMLAVEFKARGLRPGGDAGGFLQRVGDGDAVSHNVVGVVDGQLPLDSGYVLITAHWDNVTENGKAIEGAVDDAAGVAVLEEIAAAFTRMAVHPRRSAVFLVATGGETGGSGVAWYADHPVAPLRLVTAAVELDGFNQWGVTRDIAVGAGSDSTLVALLGEMLALDYRVITQARPEVKWCTPTSPLSSRGVPLLRPTAGVEYLRRDSSFAADRLREYNSHDRHRATDVIKPDWDYSGGVGDAQVLFRAIFFMAERLPIR